MTDKIDTTREAVERLVDNLSIGRNPPNLVTTFRALVADLDEARALAGPVGEEE